MKPYFEYFIFNVNICIFEHVVNKWKMQSFEQYSLFYTYMYIYIYIYIYICVYIIHMKWNVRFVQRKAIRLSTQSRNNKEGLVATFHCSQGLSCGTCAVFHKRGGPPPSPPWTRAPGPGCKEMLLPILFILSRLSKESNAHLGKKRIFYLTWNIILYIYICI